MVKTKRFNILILGLSAFLLAACLFFAAAALTGDGSSAYAEGAEHEVSGYGELIEKVNAANNGDIIILPDRLVIERRVEITKSLTFRPKGERSTLVYIKSDASDANDAYPQTFYRHFNVAPFAPSPGLPGQISFENCDFISECEGYGGGIYAAARPVELKLNNCTFENLENTTGGAVFAGHYQAKTKLIAENCVFRGNTANTSGALHINNAAADIKNCTFTGNTANNNGSAISVANFKAPEAAVVTVEGCRFTQNVTKSAANAYAGVIFMQDNNVKLNDGEIFSANFGSGIIKNCVFTQNTAQKTGIVSPRGTVICADNYNFSIENCEIKNNVSAGGGTVGISYRTTQPSFSISNTVIASNEVAELGGALLFLSDISAQFSVSGCTFENNASADGKNISTGAFSTQNPVTIIPGIDAESVINDIVEPSPEPTGLSVAAKAFITLGVVAALWLTVAFAAFYMRRRRGAFVESVNASESDLVIPIEAAVYVDNTATVIEKYKLTSRETDLLYLLIEGKTLRQISGEMGIKYDTVRFHCKNLYKKLEVNSRLELINLCRALRR